MGHREDEWRWILGEIVVDKTLWGNLEKGNIGIAAVDDHMRNRPAFQLLPLAVVVVVDIAADSIVDIPSNNPCLFSKISTQSQSSDRLRQSSWVSIPHCYL